MRRRVAAVAFLLLTLPALAGACGAASSAQSTSVSADRRTLYVETNGRRRAVLHLAPLHQFFSPNGLAGPSGPQPRLSPNGRWVLADIAYPMPRPVRGDVAEWNELIDVATGRSAHVYALARKRGLSIASDVATWVPGAPQTLRLRRSSGGGFVTVDARVLFGVGS